MSGGNDIERLLRSSVDGKPVDGFTTELAGIAPFRFPEERYFKIHLVRDGGCRSRRPVISGIFFAGRGRHINPWMEVAYSPDVACTGPDGEDSSLDLSGTEAEESLFRLLSGLVPAGGRIMVEYGLKEHSRTAKALEKGVPPVLTGLGHLLYRSGFTTFKDWYFAEGWSEGNTKLQGEKPLDEEARKEQTRRLAAEVEKFIASGRDAPGIALDPEKMRRLLESAAES
ncbi:MAG: DUF1122 family protein [Thermoleophilia bacterium]|nr:DUF1122 family protein [Thermoleophilia bacterium]